MIVQYIITKQNEFNVLFYVGNYSLKKKKKIKTSYKPKDLYKRNC